MSQVGSEKSEIRLLFCYDCKTIEELQDFDGPPEYDSVLEYALSQHETNGHRHVGKLYKVEQRAWDIPNLRNAIIGQLRGGSAGLSEIDPEFYNTRDTLKEDALKCFSKHLRPKEGCSDWRNDRYMLRPPTKADRADIGLSMDGAPRRWLCDWCPVRSYYEKRANEKA